MTVAVMLDACAVNCLYPVPASGSEHVCAILNLWVQRCVAALTLFTG